MAIKRPADYFSGYEVVAAGGTVTAESVCIPIAALPGLSAAEANATTGDGSALLRSVSEAVFSAFSAMPTAERPTKFTITRGAQTITPGATNQIRQPYTYTFDLTASSFEVASEV